LTLIFEKYFLGAVEGEDKPMKLEKVLVCGVEGYWVWLLLLTVMVVLGLRMLGLMDPCPFH
jgi:hypothetical protein